MAFGRPSVPSPSAKPKILATVADGTPPLKGVDLVRIDASRASLQQICRLRARHGRPTLLDLPGPDDSDRTTLLTTSELAIFAAAEQFEWVGLRGVGRVEEVSRVRELLEPATRIACAPHGLEGLDDTSLAKLVTASDALIVPYGELVGSVGHEMARHHVERALTIAANHHRPLLLRGGLLETMVESVMPELSQLEELADFAADGCAGFILVEETTRSPHAQLCVDTLGMILAPWDPPVPRQRGSARLAGAPMLAPQTITLHHD